MSTNKSQQADKASTTTATATANKGAVDAAALKAAEDRAAAEAAAKQAATDRAAAELAAQQAGESRAAAEVAAERAARHLADIEEAVRSFSALQQFESGGVLQLGATVETLPVASSLTVEDAVRRVERTTVIQDKGASRTVHSPIHPDEVLSFKDHGTHVVVVTVDGQKFSDRREAA